MTRTRTLPTTIANVMRFLLFFHCFVCCVCTPSYCYVDRISSAMPTFSMLNKNCAFSTFWRANVYRNSINSAEPNWNVFKRFFNWLIDTLWTWWRTNVRFKTTTKKPNANMSCVNEAQSTSNGLTIAQNVLTTIQFYLWWLRGDGVGIVHCIVLRMLCVVCMCLCIIYILVSMRVPTVMYVRLYLDVLHSWPLSVFN